MDYLDFTILDLVDITLVAFLLYQLYKLVRGTVAIQVIIGIAIIYLFWKLVEAFKMELLSEILGQFIGVGILAVIIVFQREIRNFLIYIGGTQFSKQIDLLSRLTSSRTKDQHQDSALIYEMTDFCIDMMESRTGVLMVLQQKNDLSLFIKNSTPVQATLSEALLQSIFYKNSPLHDGAVIVRQNQIIGVKAILPVSSSNKIPNSLGLRHRAAVGVTEHTDAVCIVVSEETGRFSIIKNAKIKTFRTPDRKRTYQAIQAVLSV